jgi:hypothetical protein
MLGFINRQLGRSRRREAVLQIKGGWPGENRSGFPGEDGKRFQFFEAPLDGRLL